MSEVWLKKAVRQTKWQHNSTIHCESKKLCHFFYGL